MTYNVLHFEAGASSREYGDWQQRKLQVAQVSREEWAAAFRSSYATPDDHGTF
jgi:hypothetical protein